MTKLFLCDIHESLIINFFSKKMKLKLKSELQKKYEETNQKRSMHISGSHCKQTKNVSCDLTDGQQQDTDGQQNTDGSINWRK